MEEEPLVGGIANAGKVVRVGKHLLRPQTEHTASIHAFLRALHRAGFVGAPLPIGIDIDGRERLLFIEGDVPLTPYPAWSQSDAALVSIARLLRQMHDAACNFDHREHTWSDALSDPAGGPIVCHNDLEPSNIVFRDGIAVGFIDFEYAAPGRPIYDLAQMVRVCLPMDGEVDRERLGYQPADLPTRLRLVADSYGLDASGRTELIAMMPVAFGRIESAIRRSVHAGDPNAKTLWDRTGGGERFERRRRWWAEHLDQFAAALQ